MALQKQYGALPPLPMPTKVTNRSPNSTEPTGDGNWVKLTGRDSYAMVFWPIGQVLLEEDGLRFDGRYYLKTRRSDYLTKDFKFELVYTLKNGDAKDIVFAGIGEAAREGFNDEPRNSVYLAIHPPNIDGGAVRFANAPSSGIGSLGKVSRTGTHRIVIEKKGDSVTFAIDVDNDGPTDDDLRKKVADIKALGSFLTTKNTHLFFGGGGTFQEFRISE